MRTSSDQLEKLFAALAASQAEMPIVRPTKENPYYKNKYADLSDLWEQVGKPIATKHGLSVAQFPISDGTGKVGVATYLGHTSGQFISAEFYMQPAKQDPQSYGSCLTYARRYALGAVLGLSTDEDDDGNAATGKGQEKQQTQEKKKAPPSQAPRADEKPVYIASDEQKKALAALFKQAGITDKSEMLRISAKYVGKTMEELNGHIAAYSLETANHLNG